MATPRFGIKTASISHLHFAATSSSKFQLLPMSEIYAPRPPKSGTYILCGTCGAVTLLLALFGTLALRSAQDVPVSNMRRLQENSTKSYSPVSRLGFFARTVPSRSDQDYGLDRSSVGSVGHQPDELCNAHWTWSGVASFWKVLPHDQGQFYRVWTIERRETTRTASCQWRHGKSCWKSKIQKGTAVVAIRSLDRFSLNVWHHLTAIFEAWVTPRILQLLKVLPQNISVSYQVPAMGNNSLENNSGWVAR